MSGTITIQRITRVASLFFAGVLFGTGARLFVLNNSILASLRTYKDDFAEERSSSDPRTICPIIENTTILNVDHEHFFWFEGQPKLCDLIRREKDISHLIDGRIHGPPMLVNITIDCTLSYTELGTGNFMVALYETILLTSYSGVDFQFQCSHGNKDDHILKWFEGCYPAHRDNWLAHNLTDQQVCTWSPADIPLDIMGQVIQQNLRNFVNQVIGMDGQPPLSAEIETPAFGTIVFDETAIHVHCDSLLLLPRPRRDYGIIKFHEYKKVISKETKTIGVVPQPFELKGNRLGDENRTENCNRVAQSLLESLQLEFPNAIVSIRNNEPLPLALARLVVAQQSIMGLASFPAFPLVATYGKGVFQEGSGVVNIWLNRLSEKGSMGHLQKKKMDFVTNIFGIDLMIKALNE